MPVPKSNTAALIQHLGLSGTLVLGLETLYDGSYDIHWDRLPLSTIMCRAARDSFRNRFHREGKST
jgi:hypothetical protein